jgi:hypothetical protein
MDGKRTQLSIDDLSPIGPPLSNGSARLYILATVAVFVHVTSSTSRPLSLRLLTITLLGSNVYLLLTMPDIMGHLPGFDGLIANFVFAWWLRAIDLYFIRDERKLIAKKKDGEAVTNEKVVGKADGSGKVVPAHDDKQTRGFTHMTPFEAFDYLIVNHRLIDTPYQNRSVRDFEKRRPGWVPSRKQFLIRKACHFVVAYLALDALCNLQSPPPLYLFAREQEWFFGRLNEVTLEELWFRFITNANLWASVTCLIQYIYALVAIIGVGSGVYQPRDFPPLLGEIKDWRSVRNHWGRVWHQLFTSPYVSCASALTKLVLPRSIASRSISGYTMTFFVFALSCFSHLIQPIGVGSGWPQVRQSLFFFPAQFAAILFEDSFQKQYARLTGEWRAAEKRSVDGKKQVAQLVWWEKLIGYVWLQAWLSWTCSIWVYPTLRRGGEGMMPYSIINELRGMYTKPKTD